MTNSTKRPQVLFIWPATDELKSYFHKELDPVADIDFCESRDTDAVCNRAGNADILVGWSLKEEVLSAAKQVKFVIIPAIGVDRHIPVLRQFPHVLAANSRGNAVPTAQHTVALLLAATNHVNTFHHHMKAGNWRPFNDRPASVLLSSGKVGILGTGTVGQEVIKRLSGFGCSFIGCSRSGRPVPGYNDIPVYSVSDLPEFLKQVKFLIIAVPHTPETLGLISSKELELLPDDAIVVNVARGPVVDEQALFNALKTRQLHSAAIDVWYNYRPETVNGRKYPYSMPFHELDNIILSPHRASSPLTRPDRYIDVVENIKRFIRDEPLLNLLDLDKGY